MNLRACLLLLACVLSTPAFAAGESAETRAARYYAEGLERPLLQLRTGVMLVQACNGRLRRGCDEDQVKFAANNRVMPLLDALTLFPQRLDADPLASVAKPRDLRVKIAATRESLLLAAGEYDREVFARYGAALIACPYADPPLYAQSVDLLLGISLRSFQVSGADAARAAAGIATQRAELAERWRQAPTEDCLAARKLGENLMELMAFKLKPWSDSAEPAAGRPDFNFAQPGKQEPPSRSPGQDRELALAVAGNFVSVVATELQLQAFPETAQRIKELADQAGFPSQD